MRSRWQPSFIALPPPRRGCDARHFRTLFGCGPGCALRRREVAALTDGRSSGEFTLAGGDSRRTAREYAGPVGVVTGPIASAISDRASSRALRVLGAAERVGCASRRRSCRVSDRLRSRRRTAGARIGAGIGAGIAPHEAPVMLLGCRLRRSEVAALTMGHVQQRDGRWGIVERGRPPGAGGVSRAAYGSHTSMKIVRLHLLPNLYRTQTTATAQGHACLILKTAVRRGHRRDDQGFR
jgi:hypothetical protein